MIFKSLDSGLSVEGHEIECFKTEVKSDKYIYLIAGVHGDEVEGVFVLKQYFEWLKEEDQLKELPIIVVPIVNVDGYRRGTRVNAHGVDLNRNLPSSDWSKECSKPRYNPGKQAMSEPENIFLEKLFEKFPPGICLSFHTYKPMINYNGDTALKVAEFLSSYNGYQVCDDMGYPTPGSLGTYLTEKYFSPVITFECPELGDDLSLQKIWKHNEEALKSLFIQKTIEPYTN